MKPLFVIFTLIFYTTAGAQTLADAQKEIDNENYFKARQILYKLLSAGSVPKHEVYYYLGNAYLKDDEPDSAKMFYRLVFNPDTRTALGYVANGRLALMSKNKTEAKANFDRALQTSKSKSAAIFYEIGDAYLRPEVIDAAAAIQHLESAFNLDNKNVTIVLTLADAYMANSSNDQSMAGKAMNKYEYATELDSKNVLAWVKQGRIWLSGKVYDRAIECYNKAIALDPSAALPYKELGEAYYFTRQYDKMTENFKIYINKNPEDLRARKALMEMYFRNKDYEKTLEEANRGLQVAPDDIDYLRFQFYSNYELKRYKDGYDAMKRFWDNPNSKPKPRDYIYSAKIASQYGDTARAMKFYAVALQNDSLNCDLLGDYASALYKAKRYRDAIVQYNIKKENCTRFTNVDYYYLGRCYIYVGDSISADNTFTELINKYPTSIDGYYWKAQTNVINFKMSNDLFSVLPLYQKVIEIGEKDPKTHKSKLIEAYNFSGLYQYEKAKNNEMAKSFFMKTLELDPNDATANEMLKALN
ncbi:MAG: tetratricopeptide repeat protein [Chitinophagales bacterium]|nr:tetratricopeptide repeat protein [Chitinophagales bacterium]MDW8418944.1 tetratricopeptide repeat protein [Chitinophagales bacterium]